MLFFMLCLRGRIYWMKFKHLHFLCFVMLTALLAVGCSSNADDSAKGGKSAEGQNNYADKIDIAITAQPPTLDGAVTVSQASLDIARNIFETLVTLDENYEPVPMLAESIDTSDDGKTYTFHLREGIKFHNAEEMTSEDVVASMNRWLEKSPKAKELLKDAKFEAEDTYTVVLTLPKNYSDVLIMMAAQAQFPAIMPKEIIESADAEGVKEYIGTGPYKFEEWKQDQYIHVTKYDDYQAVDEEASGVAGKKEAFIKDVYYHFVSDHSTRIAGIQTGEYDLANSIPIENYEQLQSANNIEVQDFKGGTLTLFYNTNEGSLADVKMRQAIQTGLEMDEIMLGAFANEDLYSLNPAYMNPDQTQWQTDAGQDNYNQGDIEKAKDLLDEAGYNGEEITLLTTSDYNEMYSATLVVQEQLRQLGMKVKVENFDFPTFLEKKNDPSQWDIFITSNGYPLTPSQLLALTKDWAGVDDSKITELVSKIREAKTDEEASQHWDELQGYLYEYLPSTVIGHYSSLLATTDKLEGFTILDYPIIWNTKIAK